MIRFGTTELIIILAVVILLFGVARIGRIAGELALASDLQGRFKRKQGR